MAKKYVVFVTNTTHYNTKVEVEEYYDSNTHIHAMLKTISHFENCIVFGDYIFRVKYINQPIKLFGNFYQIVECVQSGHYYTCETSDDNGKTWECLSDSKSFTDYNECYNAMKNEAMVSLGSDVDIEQDFDFSEENTCDYSVVFHHDMIVIKYLNGSKVTRFKMV